MRNKRDNGKDDIGMGNRIGYKADTLSEDDWTLIKISQVKEKEKLMYKVLY